MSKLESHQEHPLEILCYKFADFISPFCYNIGLTPNGLTTISNIGAVIAIYAALKKNYVLFTIGYIVKYLFDCADGFFARKYKMTSKFGDKYDHYSDIAFWTILIWVLWNKFSFRKWAFPYRGFFIAGMLGILIMTWIHMGCQEVIYAAKSKLPTTATLDLYKKSCPQPETLIRYTRWTGSTIVPVIYGLICVLFILK